MAPPEDLKTAQKRYFLELQHWKSGIRKALDRLKQFMSRDVWEEFRESLHLEVQYVGRPDIREWGESIPSSEVDAMIADAVNYVENQKRDLELKVEHQKYLLDQASAEITRLKMFEVGSKLLEGSIELSFQQHPETKPELFRHMLRLSMEEDEDERSSTGAELPSFKELQKSQSVSERATRDDFFFKKSGFSPTQSGENFSKAGEEEQLMMEHQRSEAGRSRSPPKSPVNQHTTHSPLERRQSNLEDKRAAAMRFLLNHMDSTESNLILNAIEGGLDVAATIRDLSNTKRPNSVGKYVGMLFELGDDPVRLENKLQQEIVASELESMGQTQNMSKDERKKKQRDRETDLMEARRIMMRQKREWKKKKQEEMQRERYNSILPTMKKVGSERCVGGGSGGESDEVNAPEPPQPEREANAREVAPPPFTCKRSVHFDDEKKNVRARQHRKFRTVKGRNQQVRLPLHGVHKEYEHFLPRTTLYTSSMHYSSCSGASFCMPHHRVPELMNTFPRFRQKELSHVDTSSSFGFHPSAHSNYSRSGGGGIDETYLMKIHMRTTQGSNVRCNSPFDEDSGSSEDE